MPLIIDKKVLETRKCCHAIYKRLRCCHSAWGFQRTLITWRPDLNPAWRFWVWLLKSYLATYFV